MNDFAGSPGQILAAERMRRNLTLADVTRQLRISERQLKAIENDEYSELPGPVFVRGFIRNYARLLHIDPEPLIAMVAPPPADPVAAPPQAAPKPKRTWLYVFASVAAVLALGIHWLARQDFSEEPEQVLVDAAKPAILLQPPVQLPEPRFDRATRTLQDDIKLVFKRESFVEIRDATGKLLLNRSNPPGSTQTVVGNPPYSLVIGNAEHVEMTYQGEVIDLQPHTKGGVARLVLN
jgi:cytoskeleton protein RodZ